MINSLNRSVRIAAAILLGWAGVLCAFSTQAQQMQRFGAYELHYIVIPTTTLQPDIAQRYDIRRGKDRALFNVSIIDAAGNGVKSELQGESQNLLGQRQDLTFTEVVDGDAVYYLATIRHANEEVHRINLEATTADGTRTSLRFTQKLYWSD